MRDDSALALLATVLLAGACATDPGPGYGVEQPVTDKRIYYVCEAGQEFSVELHEGAATLFLASGRTVPLAREPTASGARYSSGSTVLWVRGNEARLELDVDGAADPAVQSCRTKAIPRAD